METREIVTIENINADGIVSVLKRAYGNYQEKEVLLENRRATLYPGDLSRAKEILPDNQYNAVAALWTPEVIAAWQLKEIEEQIPTL